MSQDLKPRVHYYGVSWKNDGRHWSIDLNIIESGAKVNYLSADCSGQWALVEQSHDRLEYIEQITVGGESCIALGTVILEPLGDGRLHYTFKEHEASVAARAVLLPIEGDRLSYMALLMETLKVIKFDYLLPEYFE